MTKLKTNQSDAVGTWKFPDDKFVYLKKVLFKQTNVMGNTYFANYVEWQGEARESLLLEHPAAADFLQNNRHIMLVTYCVYHRFIDNTFFGDKVRIEMNCKDIQKHSVILLFKYYNDATNVCVGEGWQKVCFSDLNKKQFCAIPQLFLDLLEPILTQEDE